MKNSEKTVKKTSVQASSRYPGRVFFFFLVGTAVVLFWGVFFLFHCSENPSSSEKRSFSDSKQKEEKERFLDKESVSSSAQNRFSDEFHRLIFPDIDRNIQQNRQLPAELNAKLLDGSNAESILENSGQSEADENAFSTLNKQIAEPLFQFKKRTVSGQEKLFLEANLSFLTTFGQENCIQQKTVSEYENNIQNETARLPKTILPKEIKHSPKLLVEIVSEEERQLFQDAENGMLEQYSLLAAALIAEGTSQEIFDKKYAPELKKLEDVLRQILSEKKTSKEYNPCQIVLDYLQRRMLTGTYQPTESRVRILLETGNYNCVSATLFFNHFMEQLGYQAFGLVRREHVKSRIFFDSMVQDVETTCKYWEKQPDRPHLPEVLTSPSYQVFDSVEFLSTVYFNQGINNYQCQNFEAALVCFVKGLMLAPENRQIRQNFVSTLNNWAIFEATQNLDFEKAYFLIAQGLFFVPNNPLFLENLQILKNEEKRFRPSSRK